jgi:very-short-patch-repair endonuclease
MSTSAGDDRAARDAVRDGVLLSRDAPADAMRRVRSDAAWRRLRRGAYLPPATGPEVQHLARRRAALARIRAVDADRRSPGWFSHESAALLWGCDLLEVPGVTHVVQASRPHSHGDPAVVLHHGALDVGDRAVVQGLPVVGLARTLVDCASTLPRERALVIADSGLRIGADPEQVAALVTARAGRRGIAAARDVLGFADGRAESPGESLTRWHLARARLPPAVPQLVVSTRLGEFRADLGWPDRGLLVEFDGFVKYTGAFGRSPATVVFEEKRRQDALEEAGWRVLRVTWTDLRAPSTLARRVAMALGAPRGRHKGARSSRRTDDLVHE